MALAFGEAGAIQDPPDDAAHLGQGISYPLQVDARGRLKISAGVQVVQEALASITETVRGERVMLPDYGAGAVVFEPVTDPALAEIEVARNLRDYEPRVTVGRVRASLGQASGEQQVTGDVTIAVDATPQNLTYPYFVGPETE